jgi:dynein heavy chain 1, cytosolic
MIIFRSLESCAYSANVFKETLNKIQKAVDDLSLRQYSNLHAWVGKLDEAVEAKLALRLQVCFDFWLWELFLQNCIF